MWIIKKLAYRIYHILMKIIITLLRFPVPKVLSGADSVLELPSEIKNYKYKKETISTILIVTDSFLSESGMLKPLCYQLKQEGIKYFIFDKVVPDTSIENVEEVKDFFIAKNCQGIIAFGGGSVIDCSKSAGARISSPRKDLRKMEGYFLVPKKIPPLFAIPTTAGTGSEGTVASIIKDKKNNRKIIIGDIKLVPKVAVLDPKLMVSLPPHLTAATGIDALTHAIESYIGCHLIKGTKEHAETAVKLIFDNLEEAYNHGENLEARINMAWASHHGGLAFTRSSVGYVHNIAHQMGGIYGVPHGLANAIILPHILEYYEKSIEKRLANLAKVTELSSKTTTTAEAAKIFLTKVKELNHALNIPTYIKEIEIEDIPTIAKRAMKEGNPVSPVPKIMKVSECEEIVYKLLDPSKKK